MLDRVLSPEHALGLFWIDLYPSSMFWVLLEWFWLPGSQPENEKRKIRIVKTKNSNLKLITAFDLCYCIFYEKYKVSGVL